MLRVVMSITVFRGTLRYTYNTSYFMQFPVNVVEHDVINLIGFYGDGEK